MRLALVQNYPYQEFTATIITRLFSDSFRCTYLLEAIIILKPYS